MKVRIDTFIETLDGKAVIDAESKPLTYKDALKAALLNSQRSVADEEKKLARFNILMKIHEADTHVDLSPDEIQELNLNAKQCFPTFIYGRICQLLEIKS